MQTSSLTIEEVSHKFNVWYKNKSNKYQSIPDNLKELIKPLLNNYSPIELAKRLPISRATISAIKKSLDLSLAVDSTAVNEGTLNFIPFKLAETTSNTPITHNSVNHQNALTYCEIIKPNGIKLVLKSVDTATIIKTFLCSN